MSEQEIDLDAPLLPLNVTDGRVPCPECGHQADYILEETNTWECPHCRHVWEHKETWVVEGKPHLVRPEDCMGNPSGPYWRVYGIKEGRSYSGYGLTQEQALDDLRKKMAISHPTPPKAHPLDALEAFIRREVTCRHWSDSERIVLSKVVKWIEEARNGELP